MTENLFGALPEGWRLTSLGEVCADGHGGIQTGPFGSQLHAHDYVAEGIPTVMPTNIGDNRIIEDGIARISSDDLERLSKHKLAVGDIVYSRRGDVEKRALVRESEVGWLCGTGCLRVRVDAAFADSRFVSHVLGHPRVRTWITQHAVGATMPNLNSGILADVPIVIPPVSEQMAIALLLGALDEKIASNRRIADLLETETRTEFARLFEHAPLDRGVPISEFLEVNPQRHRKHQENAVYVDMAAMPTTGALVESWQVRPVGSGQRFVNGDVLMARITPCLENGKVAFVDMLGPDEVGRGSTEYIVFRARPPLPLEWAYCLARSEPFIDYAVRHMTGSSGRQRVPRQRV